MRRAVPFLLSTSFPRSLSLSLPLCGYPNIEKTRGRECEGEAKNNKSVRLVPSPSAFAREIERGREREFLNNRGIELSHFQLLFALADAALRPFCYVLERVESVLVCNACAVILHRKFSAGRCLVNRLLFLIISSFFTLRQLSFIFSTIVHKKKQMNASL